MTVFQRTLLVWAFLVGTFLICVIALSIFGSRAANRIQAHTDYANALEHIEKKQYQDAVLVLELLVNENPDRTDARRKLVDSLIQLGRFQEARQHGEALVERTSNAERTEALMALASVYYALGRLDDAETAYENLAAAQPSCSEPHYWLGKISAEREQYEEMVRHFDDVVRLSNDGCSETYRQFCADLRAKVARLEQRLKDSEDGVVTYRLGEASRDLGRWADAVQSFQRSTTFEDCPVDALAWTAVHSELEGDRDAAIQYYERALVRDPTHRMALAGLVRLSSQ